MDDNEFNLEMAKVVATTEKTQMIVSLVKVFFICGSVLLSIWLILSGIKPIIGQSADEVNALANFVQSFNLNSVFGYVLSALFAGAWHYERRGKQRAIQLKGQFQQQAEQGEPNRGTSGLTPKGLSPKNHE